jgi:hypothetical protein
MPELAMGVPVHGIIIVVPASVSSQHGPEMAKRILAVWEKITKKNKARSR